MNSLIRHDRPVSIRSTVAEELPRIADLADLVHIEIGDDKFVLITCADGEHLAARVAEIALAVEFADVPRRLRADAVDRSDKITVGDGVGGLFEFPKIFRLRPATVADGLKIISAPFKPKHLAPSGKCRS